MLETAARTATKDGPAASLSGPRSALGLAVFDKKGELSRAEGAWARPGGVLEVKSLGPHLQQGDVDFQVRYIITSNVAVI